jgi:hypothetical protein
MRAREFVTEVFNLTSPQTVWSSGGTGALATWTDKTGATVQTNFLKVGNTVDVSFTRTDAQGTPTWGRANNAGASSSSVFGGVAANVKDYLAKNPNITHVTFGASDDPERSRLYSKIAQKAGALGLELVDPKDRANIPPEIRQQDKARVYSRALNMIPTLPSPGNKNTLPPPPASIELDRPYTQKYDQFILKRQNMPAQSRQIVPARTGDEYTNVYGGGRPSEFQNQQYIKDIQAKLQQFPNDSNLHAELASMQKRFPQP